MYQKKHHETSIDNAHSACAKKVLRLTWLGSITADSKAEQVDKNFNLRGMNRTVYEKPTYRGSLFFFMSNNSTSSTL